MEYKQATIDDLNKIKELAIKSWSQFQPDLTPENWSKLYSNLSDDQTFIDLLNNSYSIICTTEQDKIIGMAFLVPSGNPTDIYDKDWCYIRYVTVDPDFGGLGIGRKLTSMCIETAKNNGEKTIALHTSEMMDKARHLYESLGFAVLKEINPRQGKRYWLYKLDLTQLNPL